MGIVAKAIEWIRCPKCGAEPSARCRARSGKTYGAWFVHRERRAPFDEVYLCGTIVGQRGKEKERNVD